MKTVACWLMAAALLPVTLPAADAPKADSYLVYVGTYTGPQSKGIYAWRLTTSTGAMQPLGLAGETQSPSFVAISPNQRFLYAANEVRNGQVTAFAIDAATGMLKQLNSVPSRGDGPCHLSLDSGGRNVLVANYGSGTVAVLPVNPDGSLREASAEHQHTGSSVNPQRQREPHAHSINVAPGDRFAIAADLGTDQLLVYRFGAARGTLEPHQPPFTKTVPGAGPRHFSFHPNGRFAYAINELTNTVAVYTWDGKKGTLTEIQSVGTLPQGFSGRNTTAEVLVHPRGRFLYGSNRGHNSIAIFAVDPKDGRLTAKGHVPTQGNVPRGFGIDPSGSFLIAANQNSGNLVVFRIDQATGGLTLAGEPISVPSPVSVRFAVAK